MEPEVRTYVKNRINKLLKKEDLIKKVELFKKYEKIGLISSLENALYGAFIESLHEITVVLNIFDGYTLSTEDMNELLDIISIRSSEIKEKISQASTL